MTYPIRFQDTERPSTVIEATNQVRELLATVDDLVASAEVHTIMVRVSQYRPTRVRLQVTHNDHRVSIEVER